MRGGVGDLRGFEGGLGRWLRGFEDGAGRWLQGLENRVDLIGTRSARQSYRASLSSEGIALHINAILATLQVDGSSHINIDGIQECSQVHQNMPTDFVVIVPRRLCAAIDSSPAINLTALFEQKRRLAKLQTSRAYAGKQSRVPMVCKNKSDTSHDIT